ncbi:MAG: hypothetical protein EOP48_26305 [Sphingobacteriales bacterium]|nr:MAG: hypothetical protein EOP48_26305 [Sphingobacteriales bacterium]
MTLLTAVPDEPPETNLFLSALLFLGIVMVCVITLVAIVLAVLVLLLVFGLIAAGALSTSVLIGLNNKSFKLWFSLGIA